MVGRNALKPPPFEQAETSKHALVRKLADLPDWPGREGDIRAGHAVAFPDVDVSTVAHPDAVLGPMPARRWSSIDTAISSADTRGQAGDRAYEYWLGDGRRGGRLTAASWR